MAKTQGNGKKRTLPKGMKPPWKPGQSGNPKGRPVGAGAFKARMIQFLTTETVPVKGEPGKRITLFEAMVQSIGVKAAKGEVASARLVLEHIDPINHDFHLHLTNTLVTPSEAHDYLDSVVVKPRRFPSNGNGRGNGRQSATA